MSEQDEDIDFGADLEAALGGEAPEPEDTGEAPTRDAFPTSKSYSRDDAGRFAQKQDEEAAAAAAATPAPAQAQQPWKPVWYKDEYGQWDKLGEPLRNALREREGAYERKLQEVGQPANTWKALEQKIAPYQQELAAAGVQPAQYFEQLHAANEYLRNDPKAAIQWLAQSQGVDLIALADEIYATQGGQPVQADPQIQQLQHHIARLEQQIGGVTQFQQQSIQDRQQADLQRRLSEVDEFAKDKPHFDALEQTMLRLMRGGEASTLPDAYEKASWLHPEVRERILADQRKTNVSRARAAAQSPRNGAVTNGRAASKPTMSLEEELGSLIDGL